MGEAAIDVVALYLSDVPMADILRACGHTGRWVYRRLDKAGITDRRKGRKFYNVDLDPQTELVRKFWHKGLTRNEIAARLGKSFDFVDRRLPANDEPVREKTPIEIEWEKSQTRWVTPEEAQQYEWLFFEGVTIAKICRRFKRARSTVVDHLEKRKMLRTKPVVVQPKFVLIPAHKIYRGQRYEDIPTKIGSELQAIRRAQQYRERAAHYV